MKPLIFKYYSILLLVLCNTFVKAQDAQFTQFYAMPLITCSALTGSSGVTRVGLNYRKQWPGIPGGFDTYLVSYDTYSSKLSSGIGFIVYKDKAKNTALATTSIGLTYSFALKIREEMGLRFGLAMFNTWRSIDYNTLIFKDQLVSQSAQSTIESFATTSVYYPDFSSSIYFYANSFWTSINIDHLNMPNQSLIGINSRIPRKVGIYGGYKTNQTLQSSYGADIHSAFSFLYYYKMQGKFDQLDLGFSIQEMNYILGVFYRGIPLLKTNPYHSINHDALCFMAGIKTEMIQVSYSYDMTISKLAGNTGGAHEIAIVYKSQNPYSRNKRHAKTIMCPEF